MTTIELLREAAMTARHEAMNSSSREQRKSLRRLAGILDAEANSLERTVWDYAPLGEVSEPYPYPCVTLPVCEGCE